jgi:hypothetical protein
MTTKERNATLKSLRNAVNAALAPTYFMTLGEAIGNVQAAVIEHGIDADGFDGFYCGEDGRTSIELPGFPSVLVLNWHRMESGRFEVCGYAS